MSEKQLSYLRKIRKILARNEQYPLDAYSFMMSALDHTVKTLPEKRHVTGQELLEGIRQYTLDQFGPLSRTVLSHWSIRSTLDFGHIVFALVDAGILRKQPEDKLEDFANGYDFKKAFDAGYKIDS